MQTESKVRGDGMNKDKVLNVVLLIMVFVMIGLFGYLFFTDRLIVGIENPFSTESADNEMSIEDDVSTPFVTYRNEKIGIGFTYPQDWEITEEETLCNIIDTSEGEECNLSLKISYTKNPEYYFLYSLTVGGGPDLCFYSDSPEKYDPVKSFGEYYDNFVEIDGGNYRRSYLDESNIFRICGCSLDSETNTKTSCSTWAKPGDVLYGVEDSSNEEMLTILDNILLSVENSTVYQGGY